MHRVLINNYNSTVNNGDTCYFLGDIGLTRGDEIKKVIKQLKGDKILILGNHDKKGMGFWKECGFAAVMNVGAIIIQHEMVTMTHCPLRGVYREDTRGMRGHTGFENWHGENKQVKFSIPDWGQFHIHGHIHSPNHGKSVKILDKQFDVGVVANKYRPVSYSELESWVMKYKKDQDGKA